MTYITHELVMDVTILYDKKNIEKCYDDFETIKSIEKSSVDNHIFVYGTVHLYGYKIDGESNYCGFYDAINNHLYTKSYIKDAEIKECISEYEPEYKKRRKFFRFF